MGRTRQFSLWRGVTAVLLMLPVFTLGGCSERGELQSESALQDGADSAALLPADPAGTPSGDQAGPGAAETHFLPESTAQKTGSDSTTPAMDLSLPEDFQDDGVRDLTEEEQRRFQTDSYFKRQEEERRLKLKSKVFVKDGTTFEGVKQDYRGALDGGEIGVEYKTD